MKTKNEIEKAFAVASTSEEVLLTNDIKKGDLIQETNEWYGEVLDNCRGNIRVCNIHGYFEEAGSIYVWDIKRICKKETIYSIKLTDKQLKAQEMVSAFLR